MLSKFRIGYVPTGWKKGDSLWVTPSSENIPGKISVELNSLSSNDFLSRGEIETIEFNEEEKDRVSSWMKWWTSKEVI